MAHLSSRQREQRFTWRMGAVSLFALLAGAALALRAPQALPGGGPFLALWLLAPAVVVWLRQGRLRPVQAAFSGADRALLYRLARQTWRYFDDLVGPQTNWLPPDNYQEALRVEVAPRTSPTNIGLWLLSTVSAWDFGYLTLDQVVERGLATMDTLNRLERFEGHLLNWYQIETLEPLPPRYVSMVDSGNLLASLWALRQGYEELLSQPVLGTAALNGMRDTLALVREWQGLEPVPETQRARLQHLMATLDVLFQAPPDQLPEIVRRLKAAAVPTHELVLALSGRTRRSEVRSPAGRERATVRARAGATAATAPCPRWAPWPGVRPSRRRRRWRRRGWSAWSPSPGRASRPATGPAGWSSRCSPPWTSWGATCGGSTPWSTSRRTACGPSAKGPGSGAGRPSPGPPPCAPWPRASSAP